MENIKMVYVKFSVIFSLLIISVWANDLEFYRGSFSSEFWTPQHNSYYKPRNHPVSFIVALKLQNVAEMKANLLSISNPESSDYGQFLSIDEINNRYGLSEHEHNIVLNFFASIDGAIVEPNLHGDILRVTANIREIEDALHTKLELHGNAMAPESTVFRAVSPLVIPSKVASILSFVSLNSPAIPFRGDHRTGQADPSAPATESVDVVSQSNDRLLRGTTPQALRQRYSIPNDASAKMGSQAVPQFYTESFSRDDLRKFQVAAGLNTSYTVPPSHWFGDRPNIEKEASGEASLDVQYISGIGQGVPTYVYTMKGLNPYSSENEGYLSWAWMVGNQTDPPLVQSLSYGDIEANIYDKAKPGSSTWAQRVEMEFVKMGLRGISLMFASGDWGIGNWGGDEARCSRAFPDWPGGSPWVTAVGGTQPAGLDGEVACSASTSGVITSGGGFSEFNNRTEAPWQEEVVEAYLAKAFVRPLASYFNMAGRGYPDVATLAYDYPVYIKGSVTILYGTSASSPVFAGMVSLINDMRLSRGYSPMGFLNPFLYWAYKQDPSAFHDVTIGDNACGTYQKCCDQKFSATAGWDAVTGLGSPVFSKLAALALLYGGPTPSKSPVSGVPTSPPSTRPSAEPSSTRPTSPPTSKPSEPSPAPSPVPSREPLNRYDTSHTWFRKIVGGE